MKKIKLRAFSASMMAVLQDVKSPILNDSVDARGIIDYAFVASNTMSDVVDAQESWDKTVLTWGDSLSIKDLKDVGEAIAKTFEDISDASVEPKEQSKKK